MKKGFTLYELIVVIAVLSILTLLISTVIVRSLQTYRFTRESANYQEDAARVLRDFEKSGRGATLVLDSSASSFVFYVYMPGDDYPAPSKVRYFLDGGNIKRGEIKPSGIGPVFSYPDNAESMKVIARNVVNTEIFSYYNDSSELIDDPAPIDAVRMVKISVTIDKNVKMPPASYSEETSISLRNVKTNL